MENNKWSLDNPFGCKFLRYQYDVHNLGCLLDRKKINILGFITFVLF